MVNGQRAMANGAGELGLDLITLHQAPRGRASRTPSFDLPRYQPNDGIVADRGDASARRTYVVNKSRAT